MTSRFPPRLVEFGLLVSLLVVLGTGVLTLFVGVPSRGWVVALHGAAGLVLVPLLVVKLRRVLPRVRRAAAGDRPVIASVVTTGLATAAVVTGVGWVSVGSFRVGPWPGIAFHALLGVVLVPFLLVHLGRRFRLPRTTDLQGRRTALQAGALLAAGGIAWRVQQLLGAALDGERRFTGSREAGTGTGNAFPVTSWVADDPTPVDARSWSLRVEGAVDRPVTVGHEALDAADGTRATLDCTSGWYATRDWGGLRIGRVLDRAGPTASARWVTVESVTGYRVCFPIEEARQALLATHVGGERLDHGHGAPARLVAPGRRGFQWVKWVTRIEVRERPDYGAWVSIFTSGFTRNEG